MSKYDHSDRLSLFRVRKELEADAGLSEPFDPEHQIDERFAKVALQILKAEDPDSTYTLHTAIDEVLNHWIINSDLPVSRDGCRITDPIAVFSETHALWEKTVSIAPDGKSIVKPRNIVPDMEYFEDRIFIHKEDFEALCRRKNLPLPAFWFSGKESHKPLQAAQQDNDGDARAGSLAKIRRMAGLTADELTLRFSANNIVEIIARGVKCRVHLSVLELMDRKRGDSLNSQGVVLTELANGRRLLGDKAHIISRIRKVFRWHFGITGDPFFPRTKSGWEPHFKVVDARAERDERAKRAAEHESFDESRHGGEYSFEREDDAAQDFIDRSS